MAKTVYMVISDDKYELPLAVSDSVGGLARLWGVKPQTISAKISMSKRTGKKCKYIKVDISEV